MSNNQTNQSPPSRQEKISFSTFGPAMENPFLDQPEFKNIVYLKTKSSQSPKKSTSEEHSENIRKHVKELFQKLPRVVKMFAGSNTLCPRVEESARYLSPSQTKLIIIYNDEYKGPLIVPYYWPDQPIIHDSFTKFVDAEPPSAYEPKRRRSIDEGINDNKLKNRLPAAETRDDEDDTKVGFKDDVNVDDEDMKKRRASNLKHQQACRERKKAAIQLQKEKEEKERIRLEQEEQERIRLLQEKEAQRKAKVAEYNRKYNQKQKALASSANKTGLTLPLALPNSSHGDAAFYNPSLVGDGSGICSRDQFETQRNVLEAQRNLISLEDKRAERDRAAAALKREEVEKERVALERERVVAAAKQADAMVGLMNVVAGQLQTNNSQLQANTAQLQANTSAVQEMSSTVRRGGTPSFNYPAPDPLPSAGRSNITSPVVHPTVGQNVSSSSSTCIQEDDSDLEEMYNESPKRTLFAATPYNANGSNASSANSEKSKFVCS
jgi:hypothetical protein